MAAAEYTRVTFESATALPHQLFARHPARCADLEHVAMTPSLTGLAEVSADKDPYVKSVRVGLSSLHDPARFRSETAASRGVTLRRLRLCHGRAHCIRWSRRIADFFLDRFASSAKAPPSPSRRQPGGHRAGKRLLRQRPRPAQGTPPSTRLIMIAIDAGHFGETPARSGPRRPEKYVTLAIARS